MQHFFVEPGDISGQDIYIRGKDRNHICNVLRMKPGEVLSVSDGMTDREYRCHIEETGEESVHCRLDFIKEANVELPVRVSLFQCLPKGDKMEWILQKAVELGVDEIIPVRSERTVVKLDEKRAKGKTERWNLISEAAAKQSKRSHIPEVRPVMDLRDAFHEAAAMDRAVIPYELAEGFGETRAVLEDIPEGGRIALFIGPEGGFAEEEIEEAKKLGIRPVSLGKRILRTETAALVFLSWLVYRFEE